MKRHFVNLCLLLSLLVAAPTASAAYFTAKISRLLFYEGGDLLYIYFVGGTQGAPSCAGSNGDDFSFKLSRPRAKEYLAGLTMAFAAGKTVTVASYGACIDQYLSDTLMYFTVNN